MLLIQAMVIDMFRRTSESRLVNAKRNIISGLIKQLSGIVLTFAIRTAVIYYLGSEYQGLSGLFTAILQVLNMTDLGFNTAVTFILYKPIVDDDIDEINAIINFLRKIYTVIGLVILGIGIILLPFLDKLISGDHPAGINIYVLFLIYLFNSVISYLLFAYKSTLITAMQRADVVSNIYTITSIAVKLSQLVILALFRNYYVYILVMPLGTIANNILLQISSKQLFPKINPKGIISAKTKNELTKQVKAVFISRISDIARNCFDDIIISTFLGLVAVAVYDNYYYVFTAVIGIMSIIVQAIRASVGNSLAKETVEKNYSDLKQFTFIFMWISSWCVVCLTSLYQPFMMLWMRGNYEMILPFNDMILFCVYFYIFCMTYTKAIYLEGKGLFWECRRLYIAEALGNLFLNIVLGYFFGITGILIATIITLFLFNFVGGTHVLFNCYFKKSSSEYYLEHIIWVVVTTLTCILSYIISSNIFVDGIPGLLFKMLICIFVPNTVYVIIFCRNKYFDNMISIFKKLLRKYRN